MEEVAPGHWPREAPGFREAKKSSDFPVPSRSLTPCLFLSQHPTAPAWNPSRPPRPRGPCPVSSVLEVSWS